MRLVSFLVLFTACVSLSVLRAQDAVPSVKELENTIKAISESAVAEGDKEAVVKLYQQVVETVTRRDSLAAQAEEYAKQFKGLDAATKKAEADLVEERAKSGGPTPAEVAAESSPESRAIELKEEADRETAKVEVLDEAVETRIRRIAALPELLGQAEANLIELDAAVKAAGPLSKTASSAEKADSLLKRAQLAEATQSKATLAAEQELLQNDSALRTACGISQF